VIGNVWKASNRSGDVVRATNALANPQAAKLAAAMNTMKKPSGVEQEHAPWFEGLVKIIFDPAGVVMKTPQGGYGGTMDAFMPPSALG
jgi:hypothetical protein